MLKRQGPLLQQDVSVRLVSSLTAWLGVLTQALTWREDGFRTRTQGLWHQPATHSKVKSSQLSGMLNFKVSRWTHQCLQMLCILIPTFINAMRSRPQTRKEGGWLWVHQLSEQWAMWVGAAQAEVYQCRIKLLCQSSEVGKISRNPWWDRTGQ